MKTSAERILNNIEWNYENVVSLMIAFSEATKTTNQDVEVSLKDKNGKITKHKINSFQSVINELKRIDNNFISLLNTDNISYIINGDGSLSQITKTNFSNSIYFDIFNYDKDSLIVDKNSMIRNFIFPNVKLPINIQTGNNAIDNVNVLMFDVNSGFEKLPEDIKLSDLKYRISTGNIVLNSEEEITVPREKQYVRYHGKFTVLQSIQNPNNSNEFTINLDSLMYSSVNSISDNLKLKVGNLLADSEGVSVFEITEIDEINNVLKVIRIKGISYPKVGLNTLIFNETINVQTDSITIGLPIRPNKKYVIFLRTENKLNVGFPSNGLLIDTSSFTINYNNETLTLDEFFSKYVTNFSDYLISLIKDTTIPYSLGIKPKAPVLLEPNFNIIQINKHLTQSKSAIELQKLNEQKEAIKNNITYKQSEIATIQNEVDTVKFKTYEEKKFRVNKITELKNDINALNQNLLNITRDLNSNAIQAGIKNVKPKYRLIGFWELIKPMLSPNTKAQHIIGYEIQYRYLSKNINIVDGTIMKLYDESGMETNVVVSPWNSVMTPFMTKKENIDGSISWVIPKQDSVEEININQCSISINEGESVEVRVRSISEAGYPLSPLQSDWSNILRYDFPQNLIDDSLFAIVENNTDDLKIAELNNILRTEGIIAHIQSQVIEAEKTFAHKAEDITSGFFTPEMNNIPLHTFLRELRNDLNKLMNKDATESLVVSVVDFKGEEYVISNNSTINISAGNYSDEIDLLDSSKFGSIIRKQAFIKISNNSGLPLEIKSLCPGSKVDSFENYPGDVGKSYYDVPVKGLESLKQNTKQIIYFRNTDLTNNSINPKNRLIVDRDLGRLDERVKLDNTHIDSNSGITVDHHNILYLNETGNVVSGKLLENSDYNFIGLSLDFPEYQKTIDISKHFERIKYHGPVLKDDNVQESNVFDNPTNKFVGFDDLDIYTIGGYSCGAYLYPYITNQNSIEVNGDTTISNLIIQKDSYLLIPIIFEYRMMDKLGNINGDGRNKLNHNFGYTKKIGIDLLINNQTFRFDLSASVNFKGSVTPIEKLNVSSVAGNFKIQNTKPNSLT